MSRIGKQPIVIPEGVSVSIKSDSIEAAGPKGKLSQHFDKNYISIEKEDNNIVIKNRGNLKKSDAMHGLYRSLFSNMVTGVSKGFTKELVIEGVGYKADLNGKTVVLSLGFSHDIVYNIPEGINVEVGKKGTNIVISGVDKQLVGLVASQIRALKEPEPYKGKGIRYKDEHIRRKMGKAEGK